MWTDCSVWFPCTSLILTKFQPSWRRWWIPAIPLPSTATCAHLQWTSQHRAKSTCSSILSFQKCCLLQQNSKPSPDPPTHLPLFPPTWTVVQNRHSFSRSHSHGTHCLSRWREEGSFIVRFTPSVCHCKFGNDRSRGVHFVGKSNWCDD